MTQMMRWERRMWTWERAWDGCKAGLDQPSCPPLRIAGCLSKKCSVLWFYCLVPFFSRSYYLYSFLSEPAAKLAGSFFPF
jgi:hypothetical protein